jgi:hypothetical protein
MWIIGHNKAHNIEFAHRIMVFEGAGRCREKT